GTIAAHILANGGGRSVDQTSTLTFNGTQYATLTIGGSTFTIDLERPPHGPPGGPCDGPPPPRGPGGAPVDSLGHGPPPPPPGGGGGQVHGRPGLRPRDDVRARRRRGERFARSLSCARARCGAAAQARRGAPGARRGRERSARCCDAPRRSLRRVRCMRQERRAPAPRPPLPLPGLRRG